MKTKDKINLRTSTVFVMHNGKKLMIPLRDILGVSKFSSIKFAKDTRKLVSSSDKSKLEEYKKSYDVWGDSV
jgi:hypothetical protein